MKKQITFYAAMGLLVSASAQADFQAELAVGYIDEETDAADGDGFLVGGAIYFESVDTSHGPLSEAAFLDKSSGLAVIYEDVEDSDDTTVFGRFVLDNDFILEAGYNDNDLDSILSVGIGKYLTDTSEIVFSYETADDTDIDALGVEYHALSELSGDASFSYDLGLAYVDAPGDSGHDISGGLTYYVSSTLGFGGTASLTSIGDLDITEFGVSAEYFFNESLAGSFSYETSETEFGTDSEDTDTWILALLARF